jgi:hypothetical protein
VVKGNADRAEGPQPIKSWDISSIFHIHSLYFSAMRGTSSRSFPQHFNDLPSCFAFHIDEEHGVALQGQASPLDCALEHKVRNPLQMSSSSYWHSAAVGQG